MKRTIQCSTVMHKLYAGKSVRVLFVSGLSALMLAGIMPPSARAELPGKSMSVAQAAKKVTGTVLDEQGQPMIGVTVRLRDGKAGATTDLDGKFSIEVPQNSVLVFSYIGYQEYTLTVGNQNNYIINMVSENAALDEVVVIGYQTIKRKDLTGSVASVRGEDVATMPVANVAQALQGKLPGVNVTTQDGRPDATVSIRVRGGGSISQSNDPLILVDGITVKSLDDIPSDQVESIDVLKDASSTAIYGARGANGVILVTTKGAKEGKVSVSYNGYVKFNTPTKYLDTLDPYDYLSFVWGNAAALGDAYRVSFEKLYGLGDNAGSNTGGIESYRNVSNQDIQKDVYNSSVSHNHDLTITGGNDKTRMLFSANYMDEEGMKINSYARRASFNFKINQKITKNLDVSFDARYSDRRTMGDEKTTNGSGSILSSSYRFRPIATSDILGDLDAMREGNMEMYGRQSTWDRYSPAARIGDYEPLYIKQRLRGTASLNWRIIDGLTYHTDLSYNRTWEEDKIWGGAIYNNYMNDATGEKLYAGSVEWAKRGSWGLRWTNTMSYDFNFLPEEHRLNLLLGHEVTDSGGDEIEIDANHFSANFTKDNAFAMINQYDKTAGTSNFFSGVDMPERILSFFGRVNYTLLDRYLFTFTFRADGSSKFSPEHRWGYFPAAAIGWRISEEPFMESTRDWLDNLKLRFSYGSVGNDCIDANLWSQMWTSETDMRWQYALNNHLSSYDYSATEMANRDLKWETTITRNIGVDFSFFNSRLWGSVDLYWNTTKDLLMLTSIPGITGFTATYDNIGQTSNKGIEISLSGEIYKDKDWNITAGMNINFNKGNVDELADNVTGLYSSSWCGSSSFPGNDYILKEGSPVGIVRGYIYDGFYTTDDFNYVNGQYVLKEGVADLGSFINPVHGVDRPEGQNAYPGLPKYRDMNDDKVIDELDVCEIGDMNPVHTGGFNINATWKNFDLGLYFNWSYGNDVYNVNKIASMYCAKESGAYENKLAFMKDAYKIYDIVDGQLVHLTTPEQLNAANVNAKYPLPYSENGVTSTLAIEDGSYLRLNTLTLGYSLPQNLLRKVGISKLRIYGTVYNVFTITGYSGLDPEVSANTSNNNATYPTVGLDWGTYPRARSFVVGLNLTF